MHAGINREQLAQTVAEPDLVFGPGAIQLGRTPTRPSVPAPFPLSRYKWLVIAPFPLAVRRVTTFQLCRSEPTACGEGANQLDPTRHIGQTGLHRQ